jgi:hypothetical protein
MRERERMRERENEGGLEESKRKVKAMPWRRAKKIKKS